MIPFHLRIHSRFFNKAFLPYLQDDTELQVFVGGGGSGKSVFIAQRCALDLWVGKRNYLIVRKVAATLRASVYTQLKKVIYAFGKEFSDQFDFSLAPMMITHRPTGCVSMFAGLDDVDKIKSMTPPVGVFTDLWIEEATEATKADLEQLSIRLRGKSSVTKRRTLSLNPVSNKHWIAQNFCTGLSDFERLYRETGMFVLRTTYLDNRYLAADDIDRIESFKTSNPDFYRVYGLGLWGSLGHIIFKNWKIADLSKVRDAFGTLYHGVDFGYTTDPAAYLRVGVRGDNVYITDEVSGHGITNKALAKAISPLCGRDVVECDAAEPKSRDELKEYGIRAISAIKGPDSLLYGIQWLQNKTIIVDVKCKGLIYELGTYEWDIDSNGDPIPRPKDKNNHRIDALRYALSRAMRNTGKVRGGKI